MKRVALASYVGSAIEYYDFYIYGTAAALVFPKVFFPHLGATMAAVASMATFAAAFLSRPAGAAFFGHFGDRLGRKATLTTTLLIMGLSTVAVGLVPGAVTIGVAAPVILLALRLAQGFAVGGEWAGSALLATEHAPAGARGRYGMFTSLGAGSGLVLSSLVFLLVNSTIGEVSQAFLDWAWRLPFLFSIVLIAIALYVRLHVAETPVFARQRSRGATVRTPVADLFARQRREVLLGAGSMVGFFAFGYTANTFMAGYARTQVGFSPDSILFVNVLGGITALVFCALSAVACDAFGRRRVIMVALAAGVPWAFVLIPLVDTGNLTWFAVAIVGTYAIAGTSYGPMGAFIPEIFATRYRYSGAGLALNVAGLVGGAVPPLIAAPLVATWGGVAVGVMLACFATVGLVSTFLLPETMGAAMGEDERLEQLANC
ncbi:MFS transporter [Mycobacterium sp. RTGN8]|nr:MULTISPECIES: MFS transporter [unclassified Mycobacterium]